MEHQQHHKRPVPFTLGRARFRWPLAIATALTAVLAIGVYHVSGAFGLNCTGERLTLNVAAEPGIAPTVERAASRVTSEHGEVAGRCLEIKVRAVEPAAVTDLLAGRTAAPRGMVRPDVWIPDTGFWLGLLPAARRTLTATGTHVASSPLVAALPRRLAGRTAGQRFLAVPSWAAMMKAATGDSALRVRIVDPTRAGAGIAALMIAAALTGDDPEQRARFSGVARAWREQQAPSVRQALIGDRRNPTFTLVPEQTVFAHNQDVPTDPAVAVQPVEGTFTMDYPVLRVPSAEPVAAATRLLDRALSAPATRRDVLANGFRTPDGHAPAAFDAIIGISPQLPQLLATPEPDRIGRVMQSWARLSLGIRLLTVVDVSASMNERIGREGTRLEGTLASLQNMLALFPDDSEIGLWSFSTDLVGTQDWKELVSVGPLGERFGSSTRRQLGLNSFGRLRTKPHGDTGLHTTVLGAYAMMQRTYKPEFVNTIAIWTDGRNEDPGGPSLNETLDALRDEADPDRPVQVLMFAIGSGADVSALRRIAEVVQGQTFTAESPRQMQDLFAQAVARRICAPRCG